MKQPTAVTGHLQEYPGAYTWEILSVKCPECHKWNEDYGEVSTTDGDGDEHMLCLPCGRRVEEETR